MAVFSSRPCGPVGPPYNYTPNPLLIADTRLYISATQHTYLQLILLFLVLFTLIKEAIFGLWFPTNTWGGGYLKLDGVAPLITDPPPTSSKKVTCDIWHVTCDMWHVTCEMWQMVQMKILYKFQLSFIELRITSRKSTLFERFCEVFSDHLWSHLYFS